MRRDFINQTGDSNKFWNIDQVDNSYTVTWGKIGTEGRTNDKTFKSTDDCIKEVEKLIKEKLNKGYREVSGHGNIPDKWMRTYFGKSFPHLTGKKREMMMLY
jgi:predicted DNA-binding WGR domain protein